VHGWPVAVARVSEGPPSALVVDVVRGESGLVVLGLAGDLDLTTVGELRAAVERLSLSPTTGQRVVVDLSGVAFVDSSGLNGLVTSARALEGAGSTVVLAGAGAHIVRVFEIVQLDRSVTIEPSVERALGRSHGRTAATG
jgi:anti-anti-sigma factor